MFLTRQKIIIPPKKQLSLALWLLLFDQWTFVVVVVVVLVKI